MLRDKKLKKTCNSLFFDGIILTHLEIKVSGGVAGGATPVPISNTEVKPSMADDTWIVRSWESRLLPD